MRDDSQYIHDLTAQGEHRQQDFKYEITDAGKLARSVSALPIPWAAACSSACATTVP